MFSSFTSNTNGPRRSFPPCLLRLPDVKSATCISSEFFIIEIRERKFSRLCFCAYSGIY